MAKLKMFIFLFICVSSFNIVYSRSLEEDNLEEDIQKHDWESFKLRHNKAYESILEERVRYKIFKSNKLKVAKHNELYQKGLVSYNMEINHFGDLLPFEFKKLMANLNISKTDLLTENVTHFIPPAVLSPSDYPDEIDWREKGAVTEVKNQGQCGSCWAFSTTGALEGQYFRSKGFLVSLSEQNLLDCSKPYGNNGCNGGWPARAYEYIKSNHGIDSEKSYGYEGVDNRPCRFNPTYSTAPVTGYALVQQSEEKLKMAVASVGPISVCVDAEHFQFYKSGVFYDKNCSPSNLNHAVVLIGYGVDPQGGAYWLIKNSWSTSWGENGYMKLARNRDNDCGIASYPTYPLV